MTHTIKTMDDLRWFLMHTRGFRGGQVTDVHLSKRRIFDEGSGHDVLAGNTATVMVRYPAEGILRIAKLTMQGVSDLSIFEQEGADSSFLGVIQVELNEGTFRFWFDPPGELYVVCEEAILEEVSLPQSDADMGGAVAQWTFQADCGEAPTVAWLLDQLDQAGAPCIWRAIGSRPAAHRAMCWEGELMAAVDVHAGPAAAIEVQIYGPIDGAGFGMRMRLHHLAARSGGRLLNLVTDLVTQSYAGTCLVGQTFLSHDEWENWKSLGRAYHARL
ncbi:MAG: hypothetical protein ACXW34_10040 [Nitrospira sp.]